MPISVSALIRMVVEKRLDEFSHPPPPDQTETPAEEPRTTDAAPQVSDEADAADQPVEEEEADQSVEEEETDQPAEEEETDQPVDEE